MNGRDDDGADRDFLRLLAAERGRILRFAAVHAAGAADRDDLFQEIVFQLWRAMPGFRGDASERTFVYRVALRTAMHFAAGRRRQRDLGNRLAGIRIDAAAGDALADAVQRERCDRLHAAIRRLGEVDRLLVTLHLEGLGHAEIGAVVGLTDNHVAVRLGRARRELQRLMED